MLRRRFLVLFVSFLAGFGSLFLVSGCKKRTVTATAQTNSERSGAYNPNLSLFRSGNRNGGETPDNYLDKIQPIIGQRCTVCHGCENSPCSLKMVSYKGILRGGTKSSTLQGINGGNPARLKDGPLLLSDSDWKKYWHIQRVEDDRFFPVAPDAEKKGADAPTSIFYQMLQQGNEHNKSGFDRSKVNLLEQARYDGGTTQCVANNDEYQQWRNTYPEGGMPFGCPGLKKATDGGYGAGEYDVLEDWIKKGSEGPTKEALLSRSMPRNKSVVESFENYLNQPNDKQRLVSRYLYEHFFRARFNFEQSPGEFYELVRAVNPSGQYPVVEIVTQLPNDNPNLKDVRTDLHYRFRKMTDLITVKDHIVWDATDKAIARLKYLFGQEAPAWNVSSLPDYQNKNPFVVFTQIPPSIRYKFLMDNSKYILESFTRSPVCIGSSATFAIDDFSWVWFLNPAADPTAQDSGSNALTMSEWETINDGYRVNVGYIRGEHSITHYNEQYLNMQERHQRQLRPNGLKIEDLWDGSCLFDSSTCGNGKNRNAWLSALRHETNASLIFGGEGGDPMSVFLMNFSNTERMYYSLVFNFREWGPISHKLLTWRDFMHSRLEAQDRFLSLLSPTVRSAVRSDWSTGWMGEIGLSMYPDRSLGKEAALNEVKKMFKKLNPFSDYEKDLLLDSRPGDPALNVDESLAPREAFLKALKIIREKRFANNPDGVTIANNGIKPVKIPNGQVTNRDELETVMSLATHRSGFFNSRLASVSYVRILPQNWVYTIVAHRRYGARNFATDILWARRGQSIYDYTSIYRGIIGDYPNIFFDIPMDKAKDFFQKLVQVDTDSDWAKLRNTYRISKNTDAFWEAVDWYHDYFAKNNQATAGILDLREYDVWEIPPESSGK